ncbi:MAG: hypothetical protein IKA17_03875 [Clostridia bacterium]|nr:hypothetical protein [Clostridia bacterium]
MTIERIMQLTDLLELLNALEDFCRESYLREDDTECMKLKECAENNADNEYIMLLSSYLMVCEDGDEVIQALYEFVGNCKGFAEADKEMTQQVTKAEFEAVLEECEEKCCLKSCIEKEHTLKTVETEYYNRYREFALRFKENAINLILPRIDINTDIKKYIAEDLGAMLYGVLKTKLSPEYIQQEMERYIPTVRSSKKATRELFKEYIYEVIMYKERKPEIYSKYDEQTQRVIVVEFFKKIINEYLLI